MKNVSHKSCRENRNTHFVFNKFFFSKIAPFCEIMWKNIVERDGPQMTIWHMRSACWIPKAKNALRIYNTYCFSTATIVAGTRLIVTSYVNCLSCSISYYGKEIWWTLHLTVFEIHFRSQLVLHYIHMCEVIITLLDRVTGLMQGQCQLVWTCTVDGR